MSASNRLHKSLLDVEGAAEYLGTSERHIRRLVQERRIPFTKLGPGRSARLRLDPDRLEAWIETYSVDPQLAI
jgi:excisionase family DNA binding protein